MIVLGIESSCDDTSVSVLKDGNILSVATNTQTVHSGYGGVIPEVASRAHLKNISAVLKNALDKAAVGLNDIDAVGATYGPGLVGPLLVGLNFAKGLAFSLSIPLVPVNHIESHILANFIEHPDIEYPFLALVVSGGHTELVYSPSFGKYELIGRTRDDAAGECIDKVSKMLGRGFPGGKIMDSLASEGDSGFTVFPRGMKNSPDFSFSGLKTAVKYYIEKNDKAFIDQNISDIAASFIDSVTDSLTEKLFSAAELKKPATVLLAGGVSANTSLRKKASAYAAKKSIRLCYPSVQYCTDNAAMTAMSAYMMIKKYGTDRFRFDPELDAVPFLRIEDKKI